MKLIDAEQFVIEMEINIGNVYNPDIIKGMRFAIELINSRPTAFDKEKVINEIRSGVMAANDEYIETCDEYYHGMQEAHKNDLKIVEKGGIE